MDDASTLSETTALIRRTGVAPAVPDNRSPSQKQLAVYLILASTVFERLAFYSLAINLVFNLNSSELSWDPSNSATVSFLFFGTSYLSTIVFAALSDAKLGRAKTIIIGFVLYLIGYSMIILITNLDTHRSICGTAVGTHTSIFYEHCGPQIVATLVFMAIGVGAVQVNMAVFGAEQMQESRPTARYFDKYYVAINLGAIIATLTVPLIQTDSNGTSDTNSYFYGYLSAICMLLTAAILFVVGRRYYIHTPPYDTVLMTCLPVTINAFRTWRQYHRNNAMVDMNSGRVVNNRHRYLNTISQEEPMLDEQPSQSFLDFAKAANRGKFPDRVVNDVKAFRRAIVVFLLLIPYWLIYYQIQITFPLQGQQMKIPVFANGNNIPISWMSFGDSVTIIIVIAILNAFVYAYLRKRNLVLSIRTKLTIGMGLASLTMCLAGVVEIVRQKFCRTGLDHSELTLYVQLPQYICMGLSEVFGTVTSLQFAYIAAPRSGQSLFMSLQFCSLGISSFLGSGYLSIYPTASNHFDFSCSSHDQWTFTTYFFILALLQLAFMIIILLCDRRFNLFKVNPQQQQQQQPVSPPSQESLSNAFTA